MSSSENPSSRERRMKARIRRSVVAVNAAAARGARRLGQHLHALVVADGLDLHTAALRKLPDGQNFSSRRRDGAHEIVLDPVVTTGCILYPMTINQDHHITDNRRAAGSHGGRRPRWRARCLVLLHLATYPVWPRRERRVDQQLHAACALSAVVHCGHGGMPRLRLLAGPSILAADLRRWRVLRTPATEPDRQG